MTSATPDLRLLSQPQGITAPCSVPNYILLGEQLAQGGQLKVERRGLEQRPFESVVQRPNHYATRETNFLSTRLESSTIQFTPPDPTRQNCLVASGGVNWVYVCDVRDLINSACALFTFYDQRQCQSQIYI